MRLWLSCCNRALRRSRMDETEVNGRWQAAMAKYTAANVKPIDAAVELDSYFYLGTDKGEPGIEVLFRTPAL